MTVEQALAIVTDATADFVGNRRQHEVVMEALGVLEAAVMPKGEDVKRKFSASAKATADGEEGSEKVEG
jgi:hypothetical protein